MTAPILHVWLNNSLLGELWSEGGELGFRYHNEEDRVLSLSLPIRREPYSHKECVGYFEGLLPEEETTRKLIARRFGANPNNTFSMLQAIGRDCAGAVSFHEPGETPLPVSPEKLEYRFVSDKELAVHIEELPQRPLFADVDGMRLSLAGAQDKAAVCVVDGKIALPQHGAPTTHILKPAILRFLETVENEYLCLRMAGRLGMPVPAVEIRRAGKTQYLLESRYDREIIPNGLVKRIHQEDFCQALAVHPAYKYQADGGPNLKDCFELLKRTTIPALSMTRLVELVVFNFLIGNMDAHAKNFSLLHYNPGQITLAPLYDALCTRVYDGLSKKMAMKIGGRYEPENIYPRHWERLSEEIKANSIIFKTVIDRFTDELPHIARVERDLLRSQGWSTQIADKLVAFIAKSCSHTYDRFTRPGR